MGVQGYTVSGGQLWFASEEFQGLTTQVPDWFHHYERLLEMVRDEQVRASSNEPWLRPLTEMLVARLRLVAQDNTLRQVRETLSSTRAEARGFREKVRRDLIAAWKEGHQSHISAGTVDGFLDQLGLEPMERMVSGKVIFTIEVVLEDIEMDDPENDPEYVLRDAAQDLLSIPTEGEVTSIEFDDIEVTF